MPQKKINKESVSVSITEVTILAGKKKSFKIDVDGKQVLIPVDEHLFTNYQNQFWRSNPTSQQKQKFSTLMNLIRASYLKGRADGRKEIRSNKTTQTTQ